MKIEMIMCAAVWVQDKSITYVHYPTNVTYGVVICGYRHCNCLEHMSNLYSRVRLHAVDKVQGFLTNNNRFVDRVEAKRIAAEAGQLLAPTHLQELYSEDVWLIHHEEKEVTYERQYCDNG